MIDATPLQTRRTFLHRTTAGVVALAAVPSERLTAGETAADDTVEVDPTPRFELSPHLYMQFMEPLGTNDSSVEASWDHLRDQWRAELIEATQSLAPGMMRWGGLFCSYYRWREGVGTRTARVPMHNIVWGGIESNQVGTAEFVDFCRQVSADPLMCVNLESDGRPQFREAKGSLRSGDAREAADWVAYCNQPDNAERRAHGIPMPLRISHWQLGNETSYAREGFDLETTAQKTVEFARAMRKADSSIKLIGWGDSGWAPRMAEIAGEHLQYLAFHHMYNPDTPDEPVLAGETYRRDPQATWQVLMNAWQANDAKIRRIRESIRGLPLAMTECHFAIPGNNRNDVLRTWAAGVSYARILNNHQRHGDVLKIATAADFCGTRWTVNAVILGTHPTRVFLMPVALVMRQYRQYLGERALTVPRAPEELDVVASRTGNRIYLNVVNTRRNRPVRININVQGTRVLAATGTMIADDPTIEVSSYNCRDVMISRTLDLEAGHPIDLPAASVTSLALTIAPL